VNVANNHLSFITTTIPIQQQNIGRMPSSGTLHHVALHSVHQLLVTANVIPNSPIFVFLMVEALHSSETPILTRVTLRNIPEDDILHSQCRENLKSYTAEHKVVTFAVIVS
jgi:hypothetical protein